MRTPRLHALAAVLLAGCAAAPAPQKTAAAPPAPGAAAAARPMEAPPGPEVPATPTAPPGADGTPRASAQELAEITARFNALNGAQGAPRASVAPEAFRIEDLPTIALPEPLDAALAPTQSGGDPATELVVDWKSSSRPLGPGKTDTFTSVRVSVNGVSGGKLRVGHAESTVTKDAGGGPWVSCGGVPSSLRKMVPARWEVVAPTEKGGLEYRVVNAWFDAQSCTAAIVARTTVSAKRLAGGMLYAFRQHPASQTQPQDDTLVVLGPRFAHLATGAVGGDASVTVNEISRIFLPVRRGGGASIMGRVAATTAHEWAKLTGVGPAMDNEVVVGVEVTQGVEDPSPLAIAYVGVSAAGTGLPETKTKTAPVIQKGSASGLVDPFIRRN